jgi:hypothetical protein
MGSLPTAVQIFIQCWRCLGSIFYLSSLKLAHKGDKWKCSVPCHLCGPAIKMKLYKVNAKYTLVNGLNEYETKYENAGFKSSLSRSASSS